MPAEGIRPVGSKEQTGPGVGLGQALEQGHTFGVGPVKVFEYDHTRHPAPQVVEDVEPETGPLLGRPVSVSEKGKALVTSGQAAIEYVEKEIERTAERTGIGLAGVNRGAGGQLGDELTHHPRLADARLAADNGDRRCRSPVDQSGQATQFGGPADHDR